MDLELLRTKLKRILPTLDASFSPEKAQYEVWGVDAHDRKYLIFAIPLGKLEEYGPRAVLKLERANHILNSNGMEGFNRWLDDQIEEEERAEDRQQEQDLEYALSEGFDHLQRRNGYRINTSGLPGAGFNVIDRRHHAADPVSAEPAMAGSTTERNVMSQ